MKKQIVTNIIVILCILFLGIVFPPLSFCETKGIKTSYKRYSIFKYKNEEYLCEPYTVNKDDWLYKIFRKKGEISEKDFPWFLIIFKEINPKISNIDAIEPDINILIPLKKVNKGDYEQSRQGVVEVPVVEFSSSPDTDLNLKRFFQKHRLKKGETVSDLMDNNFLQTDGLLSEEGLKIFRLANPNIKNINIIYEGTDIYLPDPTIKSQPWFRSLLYQNPSKNDTARKKVQKQQLQLETYKLAQLKKYASLVGGTLLSHGQMHFPGFNNSGRILDLSSTPIIEMDSGDKILVIQGDNINDELLRSVRDYWSDLKIKSIADLKNKTLVSSAKIIAEYKHMIEVLLSQTQFKYIPEAKIPFTLNNISLDAVFGRIIQLDTTDVLINFGNVFGTALEVLEKREFDIISISPAMNRLELIETLFTHLGYTTWANPSFSTGQSVESIDGIYAVKGQDKLFVPLKPLRLTTIHYLTEENITILSLKKKAATVP